MLVVGGLLFGSAGRWDLPMFWAYLGVWFVASAVGGALIDPTLTKERLRPGPGARFLLSDWLILPLWLGQYVAAGLDVGRFHWSDAMPLPVQLVGLVVMTAAIAFVLWAVVVNRFFSSAIRIQNDRGHHLITGGPYRFVRHPGYAAFPFMFGGGGVALGSWFTALIGLTIFLPIFVRTIYEDQFLQQRLEGYSVYTQKVRYRLLPGVW
jgi:protein-S-isoprenylcysteine O-methyltransferase Ste14